MVSFDPANLPKIKFLSQPENFSAIMVRETYQQVTPFHWETHDWNNDGDVYDQKIAGFEKISDVNPHSPNYFYLSESVFLELKQFGCIAYVKEKPLLASQIDHAQHRKPNVACGSHLLEKDFGR